MLHFLLENVGEKSSFPTHILKMDSATSTSQGPSSHSAMQFRSSLSDNLRFFNPYI